MIRIGIVGYGNLAKGAECAIQQNEDMELTAVFTRRDPAVVSVLTPGVGVYSVEELPQWKGRLDVLLLCGGSARDLPQMTPALARDFNVVDSFDTHARIPEHFAAVFSLNRLYGAAILPQGKDYTFWGKGVSQGHSDAVRRIPGVLDARQYTIPVEEALERVRRGENPELTTRQKHTRLCYVVAREGADLEAIRRQIVTMPDYFADYDTTVEFITAEEMARSHSGLPHGGSVIRSGITGWNGECRQTIEYKLDLQSNPQFTASVLVACARAVMKMYGRGETGCRTVFDLAPADLTLLSREELLKHLL